MKKYIYMPKNNDAGMSRYSPEVIYVDKVFTVDGKAEFRGNSDENELDKGRFRFYSADRCVVYTGGVWQLCQDLVTAKDEFDARLQQFESYMLKLAKNSGDLWLTDRLN